MRRRLPVRLGIIAAAITAAAALGAAPALAIPVPPPPTDCPPDCPPAGNLIVMNYFNAGGDLVGQKWWGCPGQAPGSWGVTTSIHSPHFVPC